MKLIYMNIAIMVWLIGWVLICTSPGTVTPEPSLVSTTILTKMIVVCLTAGFLSNKGRFRSNRPLFLCEGLVEAHEGGDAVGFGGFGDVETVGAHDGAVIGLVGFTQFDGHEHRIIEIGEGTFGIERTGIQNSLRGLLDFRFLFLRRIWSWEIVVDDCVGIAIVAL